MRRAFVRVHLEQADDALLLPQYRPADEEDVVHPLQFDRAVDRQVRSGAAWQVAVEGDVDRHCPVLHRRVDANDVPGDIEIERGAVVLRECAYWSVVGGPREPWRYQISLPGPSATAMEWVPGDQVVHCRYACHPSTPWRGRPPLVLAGLSGVLAVSLERALGQEAGGPVGHVIPIPSDASEDDDPDADPFGPLKREIAALRGRVGLVETTAAGYGEGPGGCAVAGLATAPDRCEPAR